MRESLRTLKTTVLLLLGMDSFNMGVEVIFSREGVRTLSTIVWFLLGMVWTGLTWRRKIADCFTTMRTLIVQLDLLRGKLLRFVAALIFYSNVLHVSQQLGLSEGELFSSRQSGQ